MNTGKRALKVGEGNHRSGEDLSSQQEAKRKQLQSRIFLDSIVDNIPNMVFVKDAQELRFVLFNKVGEMLLGIRREELIGKNDYDLFPKDQADFFIEKDREVLKSGKLLDISEETIETKKGERILHTKKIPIPGEDGNPVYLLGISEDITEQKQAEKAIRVSEEKFRNLFETMSSGVAIYRVEVLQKVGKTGRPAHHPVALYRDDRITGWRENHVFKLPSGEVVAVYDDVTKSKQAEEALRESEEKFRAISSSAQDAILMMDHRGAISFWNRAAERIFGWTEEEAVGKKLHDLLASEKYRDGYREGFKKFIRTGEGPAVGKNLELSALRKNGAEFPVELSLSAVNLKGRWNAIGIIRDITDRKQAEKMLKQEKEKADLASRTKSNFLANMSHEIRTPMNAVIGFSDMLLDTALDRDQREYAQTVKKSAEALLYLINDILDFSKIEAGKLDFEDIFFDPELVAYDVCEMMRPQLGLKPVEILCRIGDGLPSRVRGDAGRFRQVLTNLMSNACKFTDSGEVELSIDLEEETDTRVRLYTTVRDTGIGIAKNRLSAIFKAFQQADGSTTRVYGGTGLGLTISRQIAEYMEGDIRAESSPGRGSIFHFTAWLKKAKEKKTKRRFPVSLSGKRVLIADDNRANLDILTHALRRVGMKVTALQNSRDIVPSLKKAVESDRPFYICIFDIQMPGMNGYEVVEKIRNSGHEFRDIPLMAFSSLMERDANLCKEAGFDAYLNKPINRNRLYQMIENVASGKNDRKAHAEERRISTQYSVREDVKHSIYILLTEDNPVNQKLAKLMLEKAGYRVEVAGNGKEAVEKYTCNPEDFDLIFMDIQMPKMDGLEATRMIRGRGFSTVPIIAMTASAMKGDMEKCLEAGMNDYITKPIRRERVLDALEKYVLKRRDA